MVNWEVTSMQWVESDRNWILWVHRDETGGRVSKRIFWYASKPSFSVGDVIKLRLEVEK